MVFVGGLLQPGGTYVDDDSPRCPFAFIGGKDEVEGTATTEADGREAILEEIKKKVEVLKSVIQR